MVLTRERKDAGAAVSRRSFIGLSLAAGAAALIEACAPQSTCRIDAVGMAGEHDARACPHRFCHYHPDYGRSPDSPVPGDPTAPCLFHSDGDVQRDMAVPS